MSSQPLVKTGPDGHDKLSAVEEIAAFSLAARPKYLSTDLRQLYKRNILDSIACAIAALNGPPFARLRDQFNEYRAPVTCTLIGGGKTSPDQAALYNSGLTRYVDLLDSYMVNGGLAHPADNFGTILAAAEHAEATGEEFMLALAVSYEIECRFTVPVMAKGLNHAIQLAMSTAAGCGKLFDLTAEQLSNAISIATSDNISLACIHTEPVAQWKGFSPGWTGMRAIYAASMAKRGFTGPLHLFEGPKGLNQLFDQEIEIDWKDTSLAIIKQTVLKKYCSLIHGQPVIEAALAVRRSNDLRAEDIDHVVCETFQAGYDFAGGGSYGTKDHPWHKEQGDYNLKYLISTALLHGKVGPAQLTDEMVHASLSQDMVARVQCYPDATFTEKFPEQLGARITVRTKDGRSLKAEHYGYEGGLDNPMTWDRVVEKFHWLSEAYADQELRDRIIAAVQHIDTQPISNSDESSGSGIAGP